MRETFTSQSLNHYLDTAGGQALVIEHGSRQAAAAALAEAERTDRAWRLEQAALRAERYPERYLSVYDAMRDVHDPAGAPAATLAGTEEDIVRAARRADPARPWHVVVTSPDATVSGVSQGPGGGVVPADTRPPWRRG